MSNDLTVKLIKRYEGCSLKAYKCPAGIWTIGWGQTIWNGRKVQPGQVITQAEADADLLKEIIRYGNNVKSLVKVPLTEGQLGALTSFAYNLGVGNLGSSTLLRMVNAKDFTGAAKQFARWNKAGGQVLKGLVTRRASETHLFTTGRLDF